MADAVRRRTNWVLPASIVAVAILGAAFMLRGGGHTREEWPKDLKQVDRDPAVVSVTIAPVTFRNVQRTVQAVGTLYGFEEVIIAAKVEGRVLQIYHEVADRVKPGGKLLEIDPKEFSLAVGQAQKALQVEMAKLGRAGDEEATANLDISQLPNIRGARTRMLNAQERVKAGEAARTGLSREQMSERVMLARVAEANYDNEVLMARSGLATIEMQRETLAMAQQQLEEAVVKAPVPTQAIPAKGEVTYAIAKRAVSEGSFVRKGDELFRLVIEKPLRLYVAVPELYVGEVKLNQTAQVTVGSYADTFDGTVTRINPRVDPESRTFEVEIRLPNEDGRLKPGSFAKAAILTRIDENAPTVPLEAPVAFAGVTSIFLVENGHAKEVPVTLNEQSLEWVEIVEPKLERGAQVITTGQSTITNGAPVTVRTTPANSGVAPTEEAGSSRSDSTS